MAAARLGTVASAEGLPLWAFTWVAPIYQQPHYSQQLPVPQELLWEDLGMAGTQPRPAVSTSPLSSAAGIPRMRICILTPSNK